MGESKRKKMNRAPLTSQQMGLAQMANENLLLFEGKSNHSEIMQAIFDAADVVQAIVRDDKEPTGLAFVLVKGKDVLQTVAGGKEATSLRITAVAAESYEHAEAYKLVFGDDKAKAANG
jgi:hypothetical protein